MDINFLGHIEGIRYVDNAVIVIASERKQGYKKSDGTIVPDDVLTFSFIFKSYFKGYIAKHFSRGMLVKIKGFMLPYAKDKEGNAIEGYTILGQTIDLATYQTTTTRIEKRMIRDSQQHMTEKPDVEGFNQPDFNY
jgi:hypothetical protein